LQKDKHLSQSYVRIIIFFEAFYFFAITDVDVVYVR